MQCDRFAKRRFQRLGDGLHVVGLYLTQKTRETGEVKTKSLPPRSGVYIDVYASIFISVIFRAEVRTHGNHFQTLGTGF